MSELARSYTLNRYSFLYVNHLSIKWFNEKNQTKQKRGLPNPCGLDSSPEWRYMPQGLIPQTVFKNNRNNMFLKMMDAFLIVFSPLEM